MRKRGRTRLTFQPRTLGNDGFGPNPAAGGWGEGIGIGVNLIPARGAEAQVNGAVVSEQSYTAEVRNHYIESFPKIDATWRAVDRVGGRTFNIVSVAASDLDYRWHRITLTIGEPA